MDKQKKGNIINLKELRQNMPDFIERVNKGESFTVLKRSRPAFKISPPDEEDDFEHWETVVDFTEIDKNGVSGKKILETIKKIDG